MKLKVGGLREGKDIWERCRDEEVEEEKPVYCVFVCLFPVFDYREQLQL
jgi:hypothetical protein